MFGIKWDSFWNEYLSYRNQGLGKTSSLSTTLFGLSDSDRESLLRYNELIESGTDVIEARAVALSESSRRAQQMAIAAGTDTVAIQTEATAMNTATLATKAFTTARNLLLNAGIMIAVTFLVDGINKLITAEKRAAEEAEKHRQELKTNAQEALNQVKSIDSLIKRYEKYKDVTSLTSDQKSDLLQIQDELNKSFVQEGENLDLLNDKYDENIKKIKESQMALAKKNYSTINELYEEDYRNAADNESLVLDTDTFLNEHDAIGNYTEQELEQVYQEYIKNDPLAQMLSNMEGVKLKRHSDMLALEIETPNSVNAVDRYAEIYDALERYKIQNESTLSDKKLARLEVMMEEVQERQSHYIDEAQQVEESALMKAENILSWKTVSLNGQELALKDVTKDQYKAWRDAFVEEFANDDPILAAAIDKALNSIHPEEDWKTALEVGESWAVWYYGNTKQLAESFTTFNSQFDEQIDQVQEKAKELQSALSSIDTNSFDADTMTDFFQKFPDLAQYANDTTKLRSEIIKLMAENPKELIENLTKFKNALPDEADQVKVQGIIDNLNALGMLSIDDEVKRVIDDFGNLKSAAEKLESGEYEASDLQALFESFPELRKYSGDINKLTDKTRELAETEASDLLLALNTLRETTTDPEVLAGINAWIASISRLSFTTSSLLEYETSKIDDIIEGIEGQNEKLQEQLDIINEMIEGYETAASMVQTYVDEQVQALEDEKQAIEDDYNAQIKAIQDKNKEREQEINLQEKLDALLNARKKKVNVYSETNGWKLQRNSTAIEEAKREYEQARDEKQIADLEKQRDAATEGFEERIKAWNDYGDEWSKAIDKVKNAAAYEKADEILGEDWREAANRKDKALLNNVITNYNDYLNKRKPKVEAEIKENDKLIKNYESLKDEMNKMLDTTKTKTNEYLDSLMKIAPSELDSYEKRQQYLKNFCAAMDQILEDSSYGSWLIGKEDKVIDDATLNAAQQVVFQNGKLLYDAISGKGNKSQAIILDTLKGIIAAPYANNNSNKYTSTTSNVFNFSGDIKTNNPIDFMNGLNSLVKQGRLDSLVGR